MDKEQIIKRVEAIKGMADDPEMAHSKEDDLWEAVLLQLAREGNELAEEALKTRDIRFPRWCA